MKKTASRKKATEFPARAPRWLGSSAQSAEWNSTTSGTGSVRISSQGLFSTWSKLSPENIASSRLVAPGFPRMVFQLRGITIQIQVLLIYICLMYRTILMRHERANYLFRTDLARHLMMYLICINKSSKEKRDNLFSYISNLQVFTILSFPQTSTRVSITR